jgi:ribosomal protein S18 acetylase RimI-like enzyme
VHISEITRLTDEVYGAFQRLIPQLTTSHPPPTREALGAIIDAPDTVLLVARDGGPSGEIVGTLTLVLFRIPTGIKARIEDVVVDEGARRRGIGEALIRAALERATAAGADAVDLTSNPTRKEANRLYRRIGFELRETNVYRYRSS